MENGPFGRRAAIRRNLEIRAALFRAVRIFFGEQGFLEVETPCRAPAPLPEAHVEAVPADGWFLQTSPESSMKRLLAAGYQRIYTIHRAFRKAERGSRHLPEFSLLEWYRSQSDYTRLMDDCEALVASAARALGRGPSIPYLGTEISLTPPWPRLTVDEAFRRFAGKSAAQAISTGSFDSDMAFSVEPALPRDRPVFLYRYPAEKASLARLSPDDPTVAERFELYMGGLEIANAFSELCDPALQAGRFALEEAARRAAGMPPYPPPARFLEDLALMPPSAGIALGLDRLAMLFADTAAIDDVTAFVPEEL